MGCIERGDIASKVPLTEDLENAIVTSRIQQNRFLFVLFFKVNPECKLELFIFISLILLNMEYTDSGKG